MSRHALVLGISDYAQDKLLNAASDAVRVTQALNERGFQTTVLQEGTAEQIDQHLKEFRQTASKADLALVYFAGHAVEYFGTGFILPQDFPFPVKKSSLQYRGIDIATLVSAMDNASGVKILVLDACRSWPIEFPDARAIPLPEDLLVQTIGEREWDNLLIAYSTSSGDIALDGPIGGSRFCEAFCNLIKCHDLSIENFFKEIGLKVMSATSRRQRPWSYSSLAVTGSFSDIPKFELLQTYNIPRPKEATLALNRSPNADSVIASTGSKSIWEVTQRGYRQIATTEMDVISASVGYNEAIYAVDTDGVLYYSTNAGVVRIDTGLDSVFGMRISPFRDQALVFGIDGLFIAEIVDGRWETIISTRLSWPAHTGLFTSPTSAWFGGGHGFLQKIDWASGPAQSVEFPPPHHRHNEDKTQIFDTDDLNRNINAMTLLPDGRICCVGTGGLCVLIDPVSIKLTQSFPLPAHVCTPQAMYGSLREAISNDEAIARFIFHPATLSRDKIEFLEGLLTHSQMTGCCAPPSLPIVAVSDDEGVVRIVDYRDGQIAQVIVTSTGQESSIEDMIFLDDNNLVIFIRNGVVGFYSTGLSMEVPNGPWISEQIDAEVFGYVIPSLTDQNL
jgi:hypothetical protein